MQKLVFDVAIAGSISCLLVYIALSVVPLILAFRKAREEAKQGGDGTDDNRKLINLTGLVDALAKLVEALAKAGPVLGAMIGSMLFLLIAAFAAGLFTGGT